MLIDTGAEIPAVSQNFDNTAVLGTNKLKFQTANKNNVQQWARCTSY